MARIIMIGGGAAAVSTCLHIVEEYQQQKLTEPLENAYKIRSHHASGQPGERSSCPK